MKLTLRSEGETVSLSGSGTSTRRKPHTTGMTTDHVTYDTSRHGDTDIFCDAGRWRNEPADTFKDYFTWPRYPACGDSDTDSSNLTPDRQTLTHVSVVLSGVERPTVTHPVYRSCTNISPELYGDDSSHESYVLCQASGYPLPMDDTQLTSDISLLLSGDMASGDFTA